MSIVAYTGLPGSGKSYSVVEQQVLPALKAGRLVVTNMPLKRDLLVADLGIAPTMLREFPAEAIAAEPEKIMEAAPPGAVLILDEVWRLFPVGVKANKVPEPFRAVFAEHRHRVDAAGNSAQIVLVTQDLAQISSFARQLVETTFRTSKLTAIGSSKRYRVDVFNGPVSGPNPPVAQALRQIFGRYRPEVYRYYVSHTQSEAAEEGANERGVDGRANVLLRPMMIAAPFVVVGLVWFGWSHLVSAKARLDSAKSAPGAAGGRAPAPLAAVGGYSAAGGANARRVSGWRVSAVLDGSGGALAGFAWLTDGATTRWVPLSDCRRSAFEVSCLLDGVYWSDAGTASSGSAGPVASWSSGRVAKPSGR